LLNSLKSFFKQTSEIEENDIGDLHLLCGLMVEAANIDGKIDQVEINKISNALIETFNENPAEVEKELNKCLVEIKEHKSLHFFTSKINKAFSEEKKIYLIEVLWEIILEDGKVHDFESNLIRRLSGLLYLTGVQTGNAKKRVLEKLKDKN
tara:strand:+ start:5694 stop:6146 length:453 start_codon:yes stop_codon:yes gene_type:complete